MKKLSFPLTGFLQALGVVGYIALVGSFIHLLESTNVSQTPPAFIGIMLMLLLLVFSAGITGTLVFGYPVYLALQKQWKEAVLVTAYTFASLFLMGFLLVISMFLFWS
ncbi:TPA: hypothetical protein DEP34_02950 [Candidatus Uhrbacteria bacterium]|uniref:Uncharacterized protein n=2 Tax=Candidatus Uhriibacteriota TaxID=1752732 RepID=A0A0G1Q9A2_9BACT|nr:MAG: hypothetical protein UX45_C0001G0034 [Candidatus Uhrbacteria bacterium GW2011_GWF2_46_218]KKU41402.1 MAG: hypothetical protein UX57_C0004G0106 [Candidatus Uhrbacteria bacterium GW2011_GWE2_46_68]HBK33839.1 hypothetical protein [Candidatus Uhrbacteria bacterium]HCB19321.1 hypothetical protein [Candidatus Uhrbacteria bacterium]